MLGLSGQVCQVNTENQGLSGARNTGIQQATGEYVIFLDSDDEWLLGNGIETLIKKSDKHTDLIVFKIVDIWKCDSRVYNTDYDLEAISCLHNAQAVFSHLIQTQMFRMSACSLLLRRRLLVDSRILNHRTDEFRCSLFTYRNLWNVKVWLVVLLL